MSAMDDLVKLLKKDRRTGTDYTGTVTKVEGSTAYVQLTGSDITDTPVSMTISADVGDKVRVRVNGGKAWITGNDTLPPSNDKAEVATKMSKDMANRQKHIIIKDGTIKFVGDTLIVESKNFMLDSDGNATFSGNLNAAGGSFAGTVTFDWGADNEYMHQIVHVGDGETSPFVVESQVTDDDSAAWIDAWGLYAGKNGGMDYAQMTPEYGIDVTAKTYSQRGLGIDCGTISSVNISASSYVDRTVNFNMAFSNAPVVVASFMTGSTGYGMGSMVCAVSALSTTGCTIRIYNNDTVVRAPTVKWIAIGQ